ncbi:hypothetical protein Q5H93_02930 [Hymenobacter sp. ASUV-10]|uniref:Uncharacterized protein n=1 Tax=Hymenobacter aranciens TaxID=3063996 RepID=A0ABT9BAU8_9BACT|nr:hypothetical protein [Hymenobacter sp. ASUV-10]MDO7873673.1 hypothetical protein [Hymenobacter sp. ASUV-10]
MAADAETTGRKTFRLEADVLKLLTSDDTSRRYATENAAINGLLRELVKAREKLAQQEIFQANQKQQITEANEIARQWKQKHDDKCTELGQLQGALQLIGKFLRPPEL